MNRFEKHGLLFRDVHRTGLITAERDGYIGERLASIIEVAVEIRNRRTEVIFSGRGWRDGITE